MTTDAAQETYVSASRSKADSSPASNTSAVLRLRGLPFLATSNDVREFFVGFVLNEVYICRRDGRSTGEAYVVMQSAEDVRHALHQLNKKYMGNRYIELFEAAEADLAAVKKVLEDSRLQGFVVRLRGLPYSATAADVTQFLAGVQLSDAEDAIVFAHSVDGRPSGEAYVELADEQALSLAMTRHKELMGSRYIEIFNSSKVDKLLALQHTRYQLEPQPRSRWATTHNMFTAAVPNGFSALGNGRTASPCMPMLSMADQLADALSATRLSVSSSNIVSSSVVPPVQAGAMLYSTPSGSAVPGVPVSPGAVSGGTASSTSHYSAATAAATAAGIAASAGGQQFIAPAPVAAATAAAAARSTGGYAGGARLAAHMNEQSMHAGIAQAAAPVAVTTMGPYHQQHLHGPVAIGSDGQLLMKYYVHHPQAGMMWPNTQPALLSIIPASSPATPVDGQHLMLAATAPVALPGGMQGLMPASVSAYTDAAHYMHQPGAATMLLPAVQMQQHASFSGHNSGAMASKTQTTKSLPAGHAAATYIYQSNGQ